MEYLDQLELRFLIIGLEEFNSHGEDKSLLKIAQLSHDKGFQFILHWASLLPKEITTLQVARVPYAMRYVRGLFIGQMVNILAYRGCARSTSGCQNLAVLPKRHGSSVLMDQTLPHVVNIFVLVTCHS